MDILFVSTNDWVPWGGSEVLWSQSALFLKRNYDSMRISAMVREWHPIPNHVNELSNGGVQIYYKGNSTLPAHKRYFNRFLPTNRQFRTEPYYRKIARFKPKLVVFSLGDHNEGSELIETVRQNNIPYVIVVQLAKEAHIASDQYYQSIKDNYLKARKVYFVSFQNLRLLELQLAARLENAEVISNPFPISVTQILCDYPSSEVEFCLGFVASLSVNHKGHDLLFQVLSSQKWKDRNLRVNLYGKGPHEQYLKDLQKFYGLTRVSFAGFSTSISEIWSNNHACILCSRMEGQSLALLEALSYNRMPIVTDVGDANRLLTDGVSGFIAEAATVRHLDATLERAWERRYEWKEMGIRAGERLRSQKVENPIEDFSQKLADLVGCT